MPAASVAGQNVEQIAAADPDPLIDERRRVRVSRFLSGTLNGRLAGEEASVASTL